eukprot:g32100.t1
MFNVNRKKVSMTSFDTHEEQMHKETLRESQKRMSEEEVLTKSWESGALWLLGALKPFSPWRSSPTRFLLGLRFIMQHIMNYLDLMINATSVLNLVSAVASTSNQDAETIKASGNMRIIRILRLTRIIRVVRIVKIVRFIRALRSLVDSIFCTMKVLLWSVLLLVMIMYVFAIVFTDVSSEYSRGFEEISEANLKFIREHFLDLERSIMTLFQSICNGIAWGEVADKLNELSRIWGYLYVTYIAFCLFAVLNVMTGMSLGVTVNLLGFVMQSFCQSAIESAERDQELHIQTVLSTKQQQIETFMSMFERLQHDLGRRPTGNLTFMEFEELFCKPHIRSFFEALDVETKDAWTLFNLMDGTLSGTLSSYWEAQLSASTPMPSSPRARPPSVIHAEIPENKAVPPNFRDREKASSSRLSRSSLASGRSRLSKQSATASTVSDSVFGRMFHVTRKPRVSMTSFDTNEEQMHKETLRDLSWKESAERDQELHIQAVLSTKQQQIETFMSMFEMLQQDLGRRATGNLTFMEFEELFDKPHIRSFFEALDVETKDAWTLFNLMDISGEGSDREPNPNPNVANLAMAHAFISRLLHDDAWLYFRRSWQMGESSFIATWSLGVFLNGKRKDGNQATAAFTRVRSRLDEAVDAADHIEEQSKQKNWARRLSAALRHLPQIATQANSVGVNAH